MGLDCGRWWNRTMVVTFSGLYRKPTLQKVKLKERRERQVAKRSSSRCRSRRCPPITCQPSPMWPLRKPISITIPPKRRISSVRCCSGRIKIQVLRLASRNRRLSRQWKAHQDLSRRWGDEQLNFIRLDQGVQQLRVREQRSGWRPCRWPVFKVQRPCL